MNDPRVESYARLLVEHCIDPAPRWQVYLRSTPAARPLLQELERALARRGAYALLRLSFDEPVWASEAAEELVAELPGIERYAEETMDALIWIGAPENTCATADVDPHRLGLRRKAGMRLRERTFGGEIPWVSCLFPTPALAQEAGMSLSTFAGILFESCVRDWRSEREQMRRIADCLERASTLRVTGPGTELELAIEGREAGIDDGRNNLPGGEVYLCPLEDSAEGVIAFEGVPSFYGGRRVAGVRLRLSGGRVVDAAAETGEDVLHEILETDTGSSRVGEFGVGCNGGIRRSMNSILFDEKMDGTCHLALGRGFAKLGGRNESAIHWDLVKSMRDGGRLAVDGVPVLEEGTWWP
jgi:aminopeptidase